ncbi:MAG: PQQ-binding-like beta-propeller repeat protein [Kiritimatiellaeota bacterium]|nr:PQQ-binding-like beta-propeller repeat protein [Kiritimatiellota bacterium]
MMQLPFVQPPPLPAHGLQGAGRRSPTLAAGVLRRSAGGRRLLAALAVCLVLAPVGAQTAKPRPATAISPERLLAKSGVHGGLVVVVGLRDAASVLALVKAPNVLVQGLVRDRDVLAEVRRRIRDAGADGRVSAILWERPFLPYADGMVNLLLVLDENPGAAAPEIDRVLAPGGTAWVRRDGVLKSHRKKVPTDTDEWSHSRYDATGNAASSDKRVGPPRRMQWAASPRWNRGVKTSCLVSARGRIFYVLDDSRFGSSTRTWSLIARDAYNGIRLWRHVLPSWGGARGGKKVGPAQIQRRLVAVRDKVYATLGESAPVSVLDAATGKPVRVLKGTERAEEFIVSAGVLVALVDPNPLTAARRGRPRQRLRLVALDPRTGELLWQHPEAVILPLTLAADGKQVVYHDGKTIKSLDLRTGAPHWTSPPTGQSIVHKDSANSDRPGAMKSTIILAPQFAPTLIIYDGVVAFAGGCRLNVVSADDGRELWRSDYAPSNYSVPVDLFGFGGRLWGPDVKMNQWRPVNNNIEFNAWDRLTGKITKRVTAKYGYRFQHHRCYQMKAVDNQVIVSRAGIEFLDTDTGEVVASHWIRGSCYYGIMPANGLLYLPPHNCACYIRAKLSGFLALSSAAPLRQASLPDDQRLERGPAYGPTVRSAAAGPRPDDWPTYRHDMARSGRTNTKVRPELLLGWQAELGGRLTSPVVADNRLYVVSTDAHRLSALDAATGKVLWQYTFDGRVDSPPTVYDGLVLAGCRDGSVTALRATDGMLVWRFRACPAERLIVSRGQLESVWPVNGSVLVLNGTVYFTAGRTSYLDGGIHFYGLEARTGKKLVHNVLLTRGADGSELTDEQGVDGFLNDILSSNGERIFLRHHVLDLAGEPKSERISHLHSPDGYLSWETTSRLLWTYAPMYTSPHQGAFYDVRLSRALFPSGRILVEDDDAIYGFGQNYYEKMRVEPGGKWALFAADKKSDVPLNLSAREYRTLALSGKKSVKFRWWTRIPIRAWAMVETKDVLFVAGPRGYALTPPAAFEGKAKGGLLAISPADGRVLAEMLLPSTPVWDGMAAANGNLYLALTNGRVVCLWAAAPGRSGTPLSPAAWRAALPPVKVAAEPGLLGRWRFDEGAGMVARDCSGRGHDAEVAAPWGAGDFGTCLVIAGVPQAAVIPDAPDLRFGNRSFTLALWVKVDAYGVRLLGKEAFPKNWWVINLLEDGRAELVLGEGRGVGRTARARTESAIPTDAWNHLVAVVDRQAREVRWILNGRLETRTPIPKTMTRGLDVAGVDISIPSKYRPFRGLLGDFRIYGTALGVERVRQLFEEGAKRYSTTAFRIRE